MKSEIREKLKESRESELKEKLTELVTSLEEEGFTISYGNIGNKTTYALLLRGEEEIVGYTYIKDLRYKNDLVGHYKALQQAVTRKSLVEQKVEDSSEEKAL